MYIKHDIESHISEDSKTFQVIVVYGPRQVENQRLFI